VAGTVEKLRARVTDEKSGLFEAELAALESQGDR
jgi:hypothetical protein